MNPPAPDLPYSRAEQRSWYLYDFANSAFSSTVVTLFLGPYLTELATVAAGPDHLVHPLGIPVYAASYWAYLVSVSVASQVLFLPLLGVVADRSPSKKRMLGVLAYLGAGATIAMFVLSGGMYLLGGALFLVANLAFGASIVVYNSFLNDIAPASQREAVSSIGWGVGYLGGGILLALNLVLFANAKSIGIDVAMAVRINLGSAGAWWALFTLFSMAGLRDRAPIEVQHLEGNLLQRGFGPLVRTLRDIARYPQTMLFLVAFLLFNDAVQAVIVMAGQYGSDHLKIPKSHLTLAILMVQFVAFGGALLFKVLAKRMTAIRAVRLALLIWIGLLCCIFFVQGQVGYFIAAGLVGIVMGGTQALSRSLYSGMIPKGKEAECFSLYEISDKGTSWLAPLLFGLVLQFTGSYQYAVLSLVPFFVAGLLLLLKVDVARAQREAGNEESGS